MIFCSVDSQSIPTASARIPAFSPTTFDLGILDRVVGAGIRTVTGQVAGGSTPHVDFVVPTRRQRALEA